MSKQIFVELSAIESRPEFCIEQVERCDASSNDDYENGRASTPFYHVERPALRIGERKFVSYSPRILMVDAINTRLSTWLDSQGIPYTIE